MADDKTVADPSIVLDLIAAYRRSKTMFAGVELGIFDLLETGPQSASEVASRIKSDPDATFRLLNALVGLQLLSIHEGKFSNTDISTTYLASTSPKRFSGYIRYSNSVAWRLWEKLEEAIREGSHRWNQVYGWDGPIFSNFFKSDEAKLEFLMGMNGFGVLSSPAVVDAFDLSGFQCLVDLGTASGHLVIAACRRYAHLRAIAFDLPEAIGLTQQLVDASPFSNRIDVVGGDFFRDELPQGDLYALGRILHDWNELKIHQLLSRIYDALPVGGGLLIAEKILLEDGSGPSWAQMQDLNMLVCTEGKERTLSQYDDLLRTAGFSKVTGCRTTAPIDAILAIK